MCTDFFNSAFILSSVITVIGMTNNIYFEFFLDKLDYSLPTLDFLNQNTTMSNLEINRFVYNNYKKKAIKIPFSFEYFCKKSYIGENNLDYIKKQMISAIEERIWVRNNFRDYNINYVNNLNNSYFNSLKYIFSDYIFNNLLYKNNSYTFNDCGKLNIKILFNNNSPYMYSESYLKTIFSFQMINSNL